MSLVTQHILEDSQKANLKYTTTNVKYLEKNVAILNPVSTSELGSYEKMQTTYVDFGKSRVLCVSKYNPNFLFTDRVGLGVAGLAFSQISTSCSLLGCTHIDAFERPEKSIGALINEMKRGNNAPISVYFAGGSFDETPQISKWHDSLCSYVCSLQDKMDVSLKGILFDPYQISQKIGESLVDGPKWVKDFTTLDLKKSRYIEGLFTISAGISSRGKPIVSQALEGLSLSYYPLFGDYRRICSYCQTKLGIDPLKGFTL